MIFRKLSLLLGPQKVFCALADILNQERDLRFASAMVQALNVILLTAPEVILFVDYSCLFCLPVTSAYCFLRAAITAQVMAVIA